MDRTEMLKRLGKGEDPLELSIEKWQDIVDGKGENNGGVNCALCELHLFLDCKGCPIFLKTGLTSCGGTPYTWFIHPSKEAAIAELEFLKSLRKKET